MTAASIPPSARKGRANGRIRRRRKRGEGEEGGPMCVFSKLDASNDASHISRQERRRVEVCVREIYVVLRKPQN